MKTITGQVIYVGPSVPSLRLLRGTIYRNGILANLETLIERCPSIGELFVPISEYAAVKRELNFDIGRNMRGATGRYVTFYRAAEAWLASQPKSKQLEITSHA
jgi:hypothetical protein